MPVLELGGREIRYDVRESQRAKRISIRCDISGRFEIVYPRGRRPWSPREILESRQSWVLRTQQKMEQKRSDNGLPRRYTDGACLPYLGGNLRVKLVANSVNATTAHLLDDELVVSLPQSLLADERAVKTIVMDLYRSQAKFYLPRRTSLLAAQHGFAYNRVSIRNQKTRWGSCSIRGNLNFNMRLMMAPPGAIDSVIIHELCHLRVLNHSPDFWKLVYELCPDYDEWKRWFKANAHRLTF